MEKKPRSAARDRAIKAYNQKLISTKERISVWFTPEEKERIRKAAAERGMSMQAYVRERCLPGQPSTTADDGGTE